MKITNEEWCWDGENYVLQTRSLIVSRFLTSYLAKYDERLYMIVLDSSGFRYFDPMFCRTHEELDNVKHWLLNKGFKINWENYQAILEMFNERFKTHSPYLG